MKTKNTAFQVIFIASLILFGCFYHWTITLIGAVAAFAAAVFFDKGKINPIEKLTKRQRLILGVPFILFIIRILTSFWAVDKGKNIIGIFQGITILIWLLMVAGMDEKSKGRILELIPYSGAIMTLIGILALATEPTREFFWQAQRFGGFFQYANTCALFLLIGLVVELEQENPVKYKWLKPTVTVVLLMGILLTGSRTIFILTMVYGIILAVKNKPLRIPVVVTMAVVATAAFGYGAITGNMQNIGRIFSLASSNSTLWGRLLYNIDGIHMLLRHPLGMGYDGYYYLQGAEQTGVYTTHFVHNDFLQMGLDYGIISMLLFIGFMVWQLLAGRQDPMKKTSLCIVAIASLADFHFQYMVIAFTCVLCMDFGSQKEAKEEKKKSFDRKKNSKEGTKVLKYMFIPVGLVLAYFSLAYGVGAAGNDELALKMYQGNTEAAENLLQNVASADQAKRLSEIILKHNKSDALAYDILSYVAVMEGEFDYAIECREKVIGLEKYNPDVYKKYDGLLVDMISVTDNLDESKKLLDIRENLPKRLAGLEAETSEIAFKLKDKPVFTY